MGKKRTLNRMDYRGDFEEEGGEAKAEEEEKDEDEEADEEEEAEGEVEAEAEPDEEGAGDEDEEAPKPKTKKIVKPKRTRAAKVVRRKAVWRIFDNSSKLVETFEYSQRAEAEALLVQKNTDKKGFYIQLIKIEIDDKEKDKDKDKETEKPKSKK
jgi:hypothetical protein